MGQYYERLKQVAHLDYDDSAEETKYAEVLTAIADIRAMAESFRSEPGMTGQTATAALAWLAQYETDLDAKETELQTLVERHELARAAMAAAKSGFGTLAPALLTPFESRYLAVNGPFVVGGREISGAAYVNDLRAQRDAERDLAAKKILDAMNSDVAGQSRLLHTPVEHDTVGPGPAGGTGSPTTRSGSGTGTGTRPGSGVPGQVWPMPTPAPGDGPETPNPTPAPSDPGPSDPAPSDPAGPGPITVPNGPVEGYLPPSALDPDDPRWSDTYVPGGFPAAGGLGAEAGVIVGGMIGMGATVIASRALATNALSANSALALQAAAGSGNASTLGAYGTGGGTTVARAPGGGMLSGPAAASANAARGGAAGTSAATGNAAAAGTAGRGSGAAKSAGARAGRGSAMSAAGTPTGSRRGSAAPLTAGDTHKTRKKERAGLIGYEVQRLDADAATADPGAAAAAGSSADLGPVPDVDAGDRW